MTSQTKLIAYIKEAQRWQRSRYEVDLELLADGYEPEQIETAWQTLLFKPQPLTWQQQVKKVVRRPEWWVLFGIIAWLMFLGYVNSGWPAVIMRFDPAQHQLEGFLTLLGNFGLFFWSYRLYKAKAPFRIMFALSFLLLAGLIVTFLFGSGLGGNYRYREVASAQTADHTYHLVVGTGCFESCSIDLRFYSCDKSGSHCSNKFYPLAWWSDMSDFQAGNLRIDVNEPGHTARLFTVQNILIWQFDLP